VPSIAVVIATRDRPTLLERALEAIGKSDRSPDRVVVVDSASTNPEVAKIAGASGATVIRCDEPGACRARNAGWNTVPEDLVAFIDDDCLVSPTWLDAIVEAFDHTSAPAFVTGQVRSDTQPSARASLSLAVITDSEPRELLRHDDPRTMGHGANMSWRREALCLIRGFDEFLGPGAPLRAAEDLDMFWRALSAGLTGFYTPDAVVVHTQWRTRAEMLRAYYSYGVGSGAFAVKRHEVERFDSASAISLSLGRTLLVEEGIGPVVRALVDHYEMGALAEAAKLAGSIRGAWRARNFQVLDGHFVDSRG